MKQKLAIDIDQKLYEYVIKQLRLLREAVGIVDPGDLNQRGIVLLDWYDRNANLAFDANRLRVSAYLEEQGIDLKWARLFGRLVADRFEAVTGDKPERENGQNVYNECDRIFFNDALEELRTYLDGGRK